MHRNVAPIVVIPKRTRESLERAVRAGTSEQRAVTRARIVLMAADGQTNAAIARSVGVTIKTVRKWRLRAVAAPTAEALQDGHRSGRPPTIQPFVRFEIMKLACARPSGSKAAFRDTWTIAALQTAAKKSTGVLVSQTEIRRSLAAAEIRPHRMRPWLHSPDPLFQAKTARVCALYLRPPRGSTVVCVDEKT